MDARKLVAVLVILAACAGGMAIVVARGGSWLFSVAWLLGIGTGWMMRLLSEVPRAR